MSSQMCVSKKKKTIVFAVHNAACLWFRGSLVRAPPGLYQTVRSKRILDTNKPEVLFEMMWHFHINWNENTVAPLICFCETEPSCEILWCLMFCWGFESVGQFIVGWTNAWNSPKYSGQQQAGTTESTRTGVRGASRNQTSNDVLKVTLIYLFTFFCSVLVNWLVLPRQNERAFLGGVCRCHTGTQRTAHGESPVRLTGDSKLAVGRCEQLCVCLCMPLSISSEVEWRPVQGVVYGFTWLLV